MGYNQCREDNGAFSACCHPIKVWFIPGIRRRLISRKSPPELVWTISTAGCLCYKEVLLSSSWNMCFRGSHFWHTCLRSLWASVFFFSKEYHFFPINYISLFSIFHSRKSLQYLHVLQQAIQCL